MHAVKQLRRTAAVRVIAATGALALAACAHKPDFKVVGDAPELGATLAVADSVSPPRQVSVQLSQAASAVLVYVVPGQGATLVYPGDSLHSAHLSEGAHVVKPSYPKLRDTRAMLDSLRRQRDSLNRHSRNRSQGGSRVEMGDPNQMSMQVSTPQGFLMLVATKASLDPTVISNRLAGVTIPGDETEALNAIGKLVRSTAPVVAPWEGYAIPVKLQPAVDGARSRAAAGRRVRSTP